MPSRTDAANGDVPVEVFAAITVPNRVESIRPTAQFIIETARRMEVPAASESLFEVAIAEALNNAVRHGNSAQSPDAEISCTLRRVGRQLTVSIRDQGPGFDLADAAPDWSAADVASIPEGGFGLPIIQRVFPVVRTIRRPGEFGLEMALTF
jgi:anti-sigma regulatory factor (Ser/Thr protein kinase)